jgi:hypothetical protein
MNKCLSLVHLITICLLPFHMASAQTELPQARIVNLSRMARSKSGLWFALSFLAASSSTDPCCSSANPERPLGSAISASKTSLIVRSSVCAIYEISLYGNRTTPLRPNKLTHSSHTEKSGSDSRSRSKRSSRSPHCEYEVFRILSQLARFSMYGSNLRFANEALKIVFAGKLKEAFSVALDVIAIDRNREFSCCPWVGSSAAYASVRLQARIEGLARHTKADRRPQNAARLFGEADHGTQVSRLH